MFIISDSAIPTYIIKNEKNLLWSEVDIQIKMSLSLLDKLFGK